MCKRVYFETKNKLELYCWNECSRYTCFALAAHCRWNIRFKTVFLVSFVLNFIIETLNAMTLKESPENHRLITRCEEIYITSLIRIVQYECDDDDYTQIQQNCQNIASEHFVVYF